MGTIIEVAYFNTFLLKRAGGTTFNQQPSTPADNGNVWPGLPWNPTGYPEFPGYLMDQGSDIPGESPNDLSYYVEEARIEGGFNNSSVELGPRAFLTEQNDDEEVLASSLIYSGIFNSTTGINQTNVFSVGENIIKNVDPRYGSIQKIYASDTNLDVFQENKISRALIDKDAIYSAAGGGTVTSTNLVIGQITPYVGDFGISKNPESFAYFGFRRYLTDIYRNKVLRLSRDGITEISEYGMKDYFRDTLGEISDEWKIYQVSVITNDPAGSKSVITVSGEISDLEIGMSISGVYSASGAESASAYIIGLDPSTNKITLSNPINIPDSGENPKTDITFFKYVKDRIVSGYDNYSSLYTLSIQTAKTSPSDQEKYATVAYDEQVRGWTSFYSYKPLFLESLKNNYYTFKDKSIYRHYDDTITNRCNFYGVNNNSTISFIFNANPSLRKNFLTVNYEGSSGWQVDSFASDFTGPNSFNQGFTFNTDTTVSVKSYEEGLYTDPQTGQPLRAGFDRKENLYVANLVNNSPAFQGEVHFGNQLSGIKGYVSEVTLSTDNVTDVGGVKELFCVGTVFNKSS